jgi:hypothetical protein
MGGKNNCCREIGCPDPNATLPDWELDGFNATAWSQYGECCWQRTYIRSNMNEGIQYHFQDLYKRSFTGSVYQDFYGWWVRQNWMPNGPPPIGSLYPTPMPNTCWNSIGLVGTINYTSEYEQSARQEVAFQITSVIVRVHRVYNTCTEEMEFYVTITTSVRSSNLINSISYLRQTMTMTLDPCYETVSGGPYDTIIGTKTFTNLTPVWANTINPSVLYKYDSLDDIPNTLLVNIANSPIGSISESCWDGHPCRPFSPFPIQWCRSLNPPFFLTPPAYIFDASIISQTDSCLLSRIQLNTGDFWSTCETINPGVIPNATGDMFVRFCTFLCGIPGTGSCGTSGIGAANSSISSCSSLTYHIMQSGPDDNIGIALAGIVVRRKASCSPLDLIPCDPYIDWWAGGKTYPVTSDWRDLTHTKSRNVYSTSNICMNPTTYTLQESS